MDKESNKGLFLEHRFHKYNITAGILCVILTIGVIASYFLVYDGGKQKLYGMILFWVSVIGFILLFAVAIIFYRKQYKWQSDYISGYWNNLVSHTLEKIFDSVVYHRDCGYSKEYIKDMDLLGLPAITIYDDDRYFKSCNYIHACYKGKEFRHCDEIIDASGRKGYLFYGRIMEIDYPLSNVEKLKIYSSFFYDVKFGWFPSKSGKNQETGDKSFDRLFIMKCNSDEDFKKIMTSEMMEKLELFRNLYAAFALEFCNNKLYIAVDTRKKSFEPDYNYGKDSQFQAKRIRRDTQVITDAIDIFCRDLQSASKSRGSVNE